MTNPTPDHGLARPIDGETPWGDQYRDAMGIIDANLPFIRASMSALDNAAETVISAVNTPVKANIPNTAGFSPCGCLSFPGSNRMLYTIGSSPNTRTISVTGTFSVNVVGNNQTIRLHLAKNGVVDPMIAISIRDLTSPPANGAFTGLIDLSPGDYLEVWVQNLTSSNNIIVTDMNMTIRG